MNSRDLFKQLTCGVNFAATKTNRKRVQGTPLRIPIEIKKEKIETDDRGYDLYDGQENNVVQNIKKEVTEEEDGENNLNIFGSIMVPNQIAKKTKTMTAQKMATLEEHKVNETRNRHHLHVTGRQPPPPLETFEAMKDVYRIPDQIICNVNACGYVQPTPIQMQAIPIMCQANSILACAPTGSGKTATFLLPIVRDLLQPGDTGFRALILCPTRELANQTKRECLRIIEDIGLRVHTLSKTNQAENRYGETSSKQYDILVTTPKRVCYLLSLNPPALDFSNVKWLVLDEADKLFEDGTSAFRKQFDKIYAACAHPERKVALFSATWTNTVAKWLRIHVKDAMTVSVGQRNTATNLVDQKLLFVGSEAGKLLAFRELVRTGLQPPVLVFVESKDRAEQLYKELIYDGINVDLIHSDRSQNERDHVVKAFREGKIWVLICTELIGRGIDFKGVNLVVNYDFPPSAIAYIHRIGRTGRAGRRGQAITYFTQDDTVNLRAIAKILKNSGCEVPAYMLTMKEHSKRTKQKLIKESKPREAIRAGVKSKKKKLGGKIASQIKPGGQPKKVSPKVNKNKRSKSTKTKPSGSYVRNPAKTE